MKSQTLLKAWAAFGIFWFIIFSVFTFAPQGTQTVALIAAITLYAGMILAVISITFLIYRVLRLPTKKPKMKISKSSDRAGGHSILFPIFVFSSHHATG